MRRRPGDRRAIEAATALRQSLESAVLLRLYPNSEIEVHVQVLQSDGGALAAAVNAATLALIDAGVAMSDYVVGCGVAYIQRTPLLGARGGRATLRLDPAPSRLMRMLPFHGSATAPGHSPSRSRRTPYATADPNHAEASSGGAELVMAALPRSGKVTLVTMDARMPLDALEVRSCAGHAGMHCAALRDAAARSMSPLARYNISALPLEARFATPPPVSRIRYSRAPRSPWSTLASPAAGRSTTSCERALRR